MIARHCTLIGRIDAHHDGAHAGGGELRQAPLVTIRCPDAHPVTGLDTQCEQAGGQFIDFLQVLGVIPTNVLVSHDKGIVVGVAGGGFTQALTDCLIHQHLLGGAAAETYLLFRHVFIIPVKLGTETVPF
jgi:hypothetical protein